MHFVKLTRWKSLKETYINMEKVCEIMAKRDGGTMLHFSQDGGDVVIVKETPLEIMEKL